MIDTVKLRLNYTESPTFNVGQYLDNPKSNMNTETGELWGSGTLRNMHVFYNGGGIVVEGSIGGFLFPNNSRIPKRQDVGTAIEQLSDLLHLPMTNAQVVRLDCGYHWNMERPANHYFPLLCEATYFERLNQTATTLKYAKGGKKETNVLIFYDKAKECKDKGKPLLDGFGENVLRYECRWMSRVSRQFGVGQLLASTLIDKNFYYSMVRKWGDFYESINKSFRGDYVMPLMGNVRFANDFIYSILLNLQDAGVVIDIEKTMKDSNVFGEKGWQYDSLRRSIINRRAKVEQYASYGLTDELNDKVRDVVNNCE